MLFWVPPTALLMKTTRDPGGREYAGTWSLVRVRSKVGRSRPHGWEGRQALCRPRTLVSGSGRAQDAQSQGMWLRRVRACGGRADHRGPVTLWRLSSLREVHLATVSGMKWEKTQGDGGFWV